MVRLAICASALLAVSSSSAPPPPTSPAYCPPPFVEPRGGGSPLWPAGPASGAALSPVRRGGGGVPRRGCVTMKVSRGRSRVGRRKDNSLVAANGRRIRTAGRVGTKRYVDPSKVFIGNLPYDADEDDVYAFLGGHLGEAVVKYNVESVKIVRDWRTGRSRGYGFVTFLEPVMATSAMDVLGGKELRGRPVNLSQGQRRVDPSVIWVKKKRPDTEEGDVEGSVIDSVLSEAESSASEDVDIGDVISLEDFDEADDLSLFADEDGATSEDDDFEFDGVFEEVYRKELQGDDDEETKQKNREQRREASRGKKKVKLHHKGFG